MFSCSECRHVGKNYSGHFYHRAECVGCLSFGGDKNKFEPKKREGMKDECSHCEYGALIDGVFYFTDACGDCELKAINNPRETIISREMAFALKLKGKFNSVEEMWGALHIELDEVLDHIRDKTYDTSAAHYEMIQAAGILLRYVDEHGDKAEIAKRQGERHGRD